MQNIYICKNMGILGILGTVGILGILGTVQINVSKCSLECSLKCTRFSGYNILLFYIVTLECTQCTRCT
jgi:hypothetical protein